MKVGGNQAARQYFQQRRLQTTDVEAKYGGQVADEYKEILKKKLEEDRALYPDKPVAEIIASSTTVSTASKMAPLGMQANPISPLANLAKDVLPPSSTVVRPSLMQHGSKPQQLQSTLPPPPQQLQSSTLGDFSAATTEVSEFDFDAFESQISVQPEAESHLFVEQYFDAVSEAAVNPSALPEETLSKQLAAQTLTAEEEEAMERLGMGKRRVKLQAASAQSKAQAGVKPNLAVTSSSLKQPMALGQQRMTAPVGHVLISQTTHTAMGATGQDRFSSAKGISSDDYFGSSQSDHSKSSLQRFEGATAISSDDFFGRSSDRQASASPPQNMTSFGSSFFGQSSSGELDPIEMARRVAERASSDFESLKSAFSSGLSSALQEFQNRYSGSGSH
jgi:ADP-ribosylation factor GTPase-activating protein 2/3